MYYTVIKHYGHLRTQGKCRKHERQASVFYISRVFSNVRSVLSECNTRLRLLHSLYDIEVMWRKTIKHAFSVLYSDKTRVFDQSERAYYTIYIINRHNGIDPLSLFTEGRLRSHESLKLLYLQFFHRRALRDSRSALRDSCSARRD